MSPFLALADPTRRQIVETLARGERPFGEVADLFEMSRPGVSQHLKVLKEAGVVQVRRDAQRRLYSLRTDGLREVDEWLSRVKRFWPDRLDRLERALREEEQKGEE